MKVCTTSQQGLVPASEVIEKSDKEYVQSDIPDWVAAWIEAESKRPWPSE